MTPDGKLIAAVLGVLGAAAVVGVAYAASSSSSSAPSSQPAQTSTQFVAGHRYQFAMSSTAAFGPGLTTANAQALFNAQIGAGVFNVVSISQPDTQHLTIIADCLQSFTATGPLRNGGSVTIPSPTGGNITMTVAVTDQGLSPAGTPTSSSTGWTQTTTIAPGSKVLVAMNPTDLANYGAAIPGFQGGIAGFQQIMTSPAFIAVMQAQGGIQFYGPGQTIPGGFPSDDANSANEYHAIFQYSGSTAASVSALIPIILWTQPTMVIEGSPPGATSGAGQGGPGGGSAGGTGVIAAGVTQVSAANNGQTVTMTAGQTIQINVSPPAGSLAWMTIAPDVLGVGSAPGAMSENGSPYAPITGGSIRLTATGATPATGAAIVVYYVPQQINASKVIAFVFKLTVNASLAGSI